MADMLHLAGCILVNSSGKILLLHRNTAKRRQWEIPGGKIDEISDGQIIKSGRSAEQTVEKELKEELGVTVKVVRRLGDHHFTEDGFTMHYTWFLGEIEGTDEPRIGEPATYDDLKAFTKAELSGIRDELSGNTKNFLTAWEKGQVTF